jgi:hypothetical protein
VALLDTLYAPAAQRAHASADVAPASALKRPSAQAVHVLGSVAPVSLLYVPASHSSRSPSAHHAPAVHSLQLPGVP